MTHDFAADSIPSVRFVAAAINPLVTTFNHPIIAASRQRGDSERLQPGYVSDRSILECRSRCTYKKFTRCFEAPDEKFILM